ncbi:hypothetical protein GURASL_07620 [Geotalea uraniireducens]|uniref:Uncharacterized protein n=1 Tax=Geotalea uraniireducens TaxID=351604 RepID=A0ABN6VNL3_9BACT|nr:hypothetical protein [Geotalea uraniireducens]BDV41839.1 hypothetical protein GURASL_07620 [Geotalea uraniireducens]
MIAERRWTRTTAEAECFYRNHKKLSAVLAMSNFIEVILLNGRAYTGYVTSGSVGNNAGCDGTWRYYGYTTIILEDNTEVTFDHLEIAEVKTVVYSEI